MKRLTTALLLLSLLSLSFAIQAEHRYGQSLCKLPDYRCIKVKRGDSWERLWPNEEQRDLVKRINRMNINLWPGLILAVPKNIRVVTIYDVAPFPRYIEPPKEKTIYVSQKHLAWAAYNTDGELIWWGPASPGKNFCPDVHNECRTPSGSFRIERRDGIDCVSTEFPIHPDGTKGGAPMPYCMHFHLGFALHGSQVVPGVRDSHGCVRLFIEDARWLNEEFIELPVHGQRGTKVVIEEI